MSLIYTTQLRENWLEVFCTNCLESIGQLTSQEVGALSVAGITPLCFGCDGVECERIPDHLKLDEPVYLLILGDEKFIVNWEELAKHQGRRVQYYKGVTSDLFGHLSQSWELWGQQSLSSSSNLHKLTLEKDAK